MVNTLLLVASLVSLVIWLIQEKKARPQIQKNLDIYVKAGKTLSVDELEKAAFPQWSDMALKAVMALWFVWIIAVVWIKDGDFALVLVVLTLLSGVIYLLDHCLFTKARQSYVDSKAVADFFAKYTDEQREKLSTLFGQEMVVAEYARSFFPVLFVVLLLRSFIAEPFQIPSASMVPTLKVGDYILVNKFTYGLRLPVLQTKILDVSEPERGDIMVFFPPHDNRYFIKRVIGLPGDVIKYENKRLTVNGEEVPMTFLAEQSWTRPITRVYSEELDGVSHRVHVTNMLTRLDNRSFTVKPGHYFMMGDNRDNSSDSRVWGEVPEKNIVGKAFAIWMHWPSITKLPDFSRVGIIE